MVERNEIKSTINSFSFFSFWLNSKAKIILYISHHPPRPFCSTHQILLLRFKKKAVHCSLSCLITINMDNKACLKLLVLFLGFSFVLSSTAVPATSETHASIFFFFFFCLFVYLFILRICCQHFMF